MQRTHNREFVGSNPWNHYILDGSKSNFFIKNYRLPNGAHQRAKKNIFLGKCLDRKKIQKIQWMSHYKMIFFPQNTLKQYC